MPVTATLKLVLRDLPETRERMVWSIWRSKRTAGTAQGHQPGQRPAVSLLAGEAVEDGVHEG